jgi:hypothetical protein
MELERELGWRPEDMLSFNYVSTASGCTSSGARPVHLGLSPAKAAEEVAIRCRSGTIQMLKNVSAGQVLRVKEPI